ncbi:LytTR family DNA-binding domain-containing protein [Aquimarina sp. MMG016]|uniref:LytR/AlgR family response regulator transcription factor n=1 Tax=Aquimarina sp. MMG016 TaxID=2822690 RepID=UPI001B39DB8B|nr:LytTR family DNA-binding domain-containing protein [Aquimarina sp. MMG016]MBQ4822719.1 response regulator transcription factor [Aquimarina sp. MMG016]
MKIKCLIVDDEPLAVKIIEKHLEKFEKYEVVKTCDNPIEAFDVLSKEDIDLIFLDINMPKLNGIEFIKNLSSSPFIIITSAYREYAVECYELNVLDYLIKPIYLQRLMKALNRVSRSISTKSDSFKIVSAISGSKTHTKDYFFVKVNKKMVKIYFKDILYIESLKDYVSIKTIYDDYVTHCNLLAMTKLIPKQDFMRIHRSYTISLHKVEAIDGNCVQIENKMIPIGRNYVKEVKTKILNGFVQ